MIRSSRGRLVWLAWPILVAALGAQWVFGSKLPFEWQQQTQPPLPPTPAMMSLASLGERPAAATAAVLFAQSFDAQAGRVVPIKALDISRIQQWLALAAELNPTSAYPSFLSSRLYAEQAPPELTRKILHWIADLHRLHPHTHWPALAHAVHLARHRLLDQPLARTLAGALSATPAHVPIPPWARQMQAFLQTDNTELDDAQALIGGLIASGQVTDERAIAVLLADLKAIEARLESDKRTQETLPNSENSPETISVMPGLAIQAPRRNR